MIPCPICSKPVPATWPNGRPRTFCSRLCANRANNARHTSMDEVAVIRLTSGSPVPSTKAERLEAVRLLVGRGYSTRSVAERLHTTTRSVWRYRAELNRKAVAA